MGVSKIERNYKLSKQTHTEASRNVENCFPAQEKPERRVKNADVCSSPMSPVSKLVSISSSQLPPRSTESTPAWTMIHQAVDQLPSGGNELTASASSSVRSLASPLFQLESSFSIEESSIFMSENL